MHIIPGAGLTMALYPPQLKPGPVLYADTLVVQAGSNYVSKIH
jgi:hypothetical protein